MGDEADYRIGWMQFPFDVRATMRANKPLATCRNCGAFGLYAGRDRNNRRMLFNQDGSEHICDERTVHGQVANDFEVL